MPTSYREIPLTRGLVTIVDEDLYPIISQHRWHSSPKGYAVRTVGWRKGERYEVSVHHEVLRLRGVVVPSGCEVHHCNDIPYDNRFENLSILDYSSHKHTRPRQSNNASGYRGVTLDKRRGTWRAELMVDGRRRWLGSYATAQEASAAYEAAKAPLVQVAFAEAQRLREIEREEAASGVVD